MNLVPTRKEAAEQLHKDWEVDRCYTSGNEKLCATLTNQDVEVVVHPYSPDNHLPGLSPAHLARKDQPPETLEVIDKGINSREGAREAFQAAIHHIRGP